MDVEETEQERKPEQEREPKQERKPELKQEPELELEREPEQEANMIPKDPIMLLSFINMKLRDFYPSLDVLCNEMDVSMQEITERLEAAGYRYDQERNQFV